MRLRKKKSFIDHASEFAESALESLESAYESAKESAGPVLTDAKDRATPLIEQGRAVAAEKAAEGRVLAAEKAAAAAAMAREKAAEGRALAAEQAASGKDLAAAQFARLKGEEPEPKGSKLKKFLLVTGLLAVCGFVVKMLRDRQANDNWESSYVPPAPVPPMSADTRSPADGLVNPLTDPLPGQAGDDPGGAGPDEAMSDAAETAHPVTTPEDPADVVEVDPADEGSKRK